jgi:hypothetical protein
MNLAHYLDTVDIHLKNLSNNIDKLNKASINNNVRDDKLKAATKSKTSFLSTTITSLQSIKTLVEKIQVAEPTVITALYDIESRITSMQAALTAMNPPPILERFTSTMNPYDQPSPSATQAREFGLGRRAYIDEIFSGIKLF